MIKHSRKKVFREHVISYQGDIYIKITMYVYTFNILHDFSLCHPLPCHNFADGTCGWTTFQSFIMHNDRVKLHGIVCKQTLSMKWIEIGVWKWSSFFLNSQSKVKFKKQEQTSKQTDKEIEYGTQIVYPF